MGRETRAGVSGLSVFAYLNAENARKAFAVTYSGGAMHLDLPPEPVAYSGGGKRGAVVDLSRAARQRMAWAAAAMQDKFGMMATLTVATDVRPSSRQFKRALNAWLQAMRRESRPAFWFLEFTERGWPHAHVFLGGEHPGVPVRIPGKHGRKARLVYLDRSRRESERWAGLLRSAMGGDVEAVDDARDYMSVQGCLEGRGHAFARMSRASVRWERLEGGEGAGRYAAKYAAGDGKAAQKTAPEWFGSGRWWGVSGTRPEAVKVEVLDAEKAAAAATFVSPDGWTYRRSRWFKAKDFDFALETRFASKSGHAVTEGNEDGLDDG